MWKDDLTWARLHDESVLPANNVCNSWGVQMSTFLTQSIVGAHSDPICMRQVKSFELSFGFSPQQSPYLLMLGTRQLVFVRSQTDNMDTISILLPDPAMGTTKSTANLSWQFSRPSCLVRNRHRSLHLQQTHRTHRKKWLARVPGRGGKEALLPADRHETTRIQHWCP